MDDNKLEGTARDFGGKAQEMAGKLTGDTKMKADGKLDQATGTAQK
ncbi:MAG: CsbD family protein, partial [Janthinobacterium lividum]